MLFDTPCARTVARHAIHLHQRANNVWLVRPRCWAVLDLSVSGPAPCWSCDYLEMVRGHALSRAARRVALASVAKWRHIDLEKGALRDPP